MRPSSFVVKLLLALVAGAIFGGLTYGGLSSGQFSGFSDQLSDRLQPTGKADERVVVVAIDRPALSVGGRWPWPRRLHAEIVKELRNAGAKVIAYDVSFSQESPDDEILASSIQSAGNVVLAASGVLDCRAPSICSVGRDFALPVQNIGQRAAAVGHVFIDPDDDGVVRTLPLVIDAEREFLPSLSLAAYNLAKDLDDPLTLRPDGVQIGSERIPAGRQANLRIAYAPELRPVELEPEAQVISAADVLDGRITRQQVDGKVVFVGVTDPTLGDNRSTPVAKARVEMPGVLIHANATSAMLTETFLEDVTDSRVALAAAVLAFVVALATLLLPVSLAPIAALLALAGYAFWAVVQFDNGAVLNLIYPPLAIALAFIAALGYRYFTELRGRRKVSALFSQYVPRGVAAELISSGRVDETIRGERLEISALFCDLRGFTATSADLEPTQVRDLLNVYYDECSQLVFKYTGTLMTYIGDEVFAVWGAPLPDPEHAAKAVACARAMQEAKKALDERLASDGLPSVTYGIGVHSGDVIAAHVGTELHRQYTVLGDTVNCASRLCTIAGKNEIAVSQQTYEQLDEKPPAKTLPGVKLKGVARDLIPHKLWPEEFWDPTGQQRGKLEA
jgi:adenylate cyclase